MWGAPLERVLVRSLASSSWILRCLLRQCAKSVRHLIRPCKPGRAGSPGDERGQEHDDGPVRLHVSADRPYGGGGHRVGARGADRVEPAGEDGVTETVADQLFGCGNADVDGPL